MIASAASEVNAQMNLAYWKNFSLTGIETLTKTDIHLATLRTLAEFETLSKAERGIVYNR